MDADWWLVRKLAAAVPPTAAGSSGFIPSSYLKLLPAERTMEPAPAPAPIAAAAAGQATAASDEGSCTQ